MKPSLTVALPTFNPRQDFLDRVMASLRAQTVPPSQWDLLLVDNNSNPPLADLVDLSWHPRASVLVERTQGKMHAIAAAFRNTRTDLVMFLDDDTVAAPDLIAETLKIGDLHVTLGTWSPRVELDLEDKNAIVPQPLRQMLSERLIENLGALNVKLTPPDVAAISNAVPANAVKGTRYPEAQMASLYI